MLEVIALATLLVGGFLLVVAAVKFMNWTFRRDPRRNDEERYR